MFNGIELDFFYFIETDIPICLSLYINVKGNFSKNENDVRYEFTISDNVGTADISHIIKLINPEIYEEISDIAEYKVDDYS